MIINFYFACTLAITLMLIVPTILIFALKNKPRILKPIIVTLFVIYLILLFVGTAGKISLKSDVLKISFDFSHEWFSAYFSWFELSAGNILINLLSFCTTFIDSSIYVPISVTIALGALHFNNSVMTDAS